MLKKKLVLTSLLAAITLAPAMSIPHTYAASSQEMVQFQINNKSFVNNLGEHSLSVTPYIVHNNSMIPLRALMESLGADIVWSQANQTVSLMGKSFGKLTMKVNDNYMHTEQGDKVKLSERLVNINGTLFAPARSIAQLIEADILWNNATRTITITNKSNNENTFTFNYDFNNSDNGWKGDFADLPVDYNREIYELEYARELIPLNRSNTTNYGMKLKGMNRSDDLFMFMTKKVQELEPNTMYSVKLQFGMYTNQSGGMLGIGGAPGEAVYIKAGVLGTEPKAIKKDNSGILNYQMNIDKGNQMEEGLDAQTLGNIMKPESEKEGYQLVNFDYNTIMTTNSNGELFVLIGSDSGYEGLTKLYFDDIKLTATKK
jgi:hypothetical protein